MSQNPSKTKHGDDNTKCTANLSGRLFVLDWINNTNDLLVPCQRKEGKRRRKKEEQGKKERRKEIDRQTDGGDYH